MMNSEVINQIFSNQSMNLKNSAKPDIPARKRINVSIALIFNYF